MDIPEEVKESESFDCHSDDSPFAEDEEHAGEEADGTANLLFPCKEVEGLLRSDQECNTSCEENIAECK